MTDVLFIGQFTDNTVGATGLTVTIDIDRYTIADGTRTALLTGGSCTEGRNGLYSYRLTGADLATYLYVAVIKTAASAVDQNEVASLGMVVPDVKPSTLATAAALATVDGIVDDILVDTGTTLPGLLAGVGSGSGTGYYSDTVDDGTSPLDGVRVQLYTAADRVGLAYEAYTDALGVFEMWPDTGTYYRWLDLAGYSFTQDVEVEVTEP